MTDSIDCSGVKETKNDNDRLRRDLWHKYAQGSDKIKSKGVVIKLKRLANLNKSFNIINLSRLIIYKLYISNMDKLWKN